MCAVRARVAIRPGGPRVFAARSAGGVRTWVRAEGTVPQEISTGRRLSQTNAERQRARAPVGEVGVDDVKWQGG